MMWSANHNLNQLVTEVVCHKETERLHELEAALTNARPQYTSLLKNTERKASDREIVRKSNKEPLALAGIDRKLTLGEDFIEEVLIISDLLEMNEILTVELLLTAEGQLPSYPDLTRGLVAVLLYYDSRRCLVESLRNMIHARRGRCWTVDLPEEVQRVVQSYTDALWEENELEKKILDLLVSLDVKSTVERLEKVRGLGRARHRHQFRLLFSAVRTGLADCVLLWACQTALRREEVVRLLEHVSKHVAGTCLGGETADRSSVLLLMAALYAVDVGEEDEQPLRAIHDAVRGMEAGGESALVKLAWAQSLRRLAQSADADVTEEDEATAEASIEEGVFPFLRRLMEQRRWVVAEENCVRRLHAIVTDFLVQMPLRVKELRNRGDETARLVEQCARDGTEPPKPLRRDFEELMLMVGELYAGDAALDLCDDFWCQQDPAASPPHLRGPQGDVLRLSYKQLSLYKFVRLAGDLVLMPALYIPYLRMLRGLSNSRYSASMCYSLLKANAAGVVSWDHFFRSLHLYLSAMRQELSSGAGMMAGGSTLGLSALQPMQYTPHLYYPAGRVHKGITPQEMDGLRNVLQLMRKVVEMDDVARAALVENPDYQPISLFFGLLSCSVPITLKAEMLETLAVIAGSSQNALSILRAFEASQILATPAAGLARQRVSGLHTELDETEPKSEEYPLARGFLRLLAALSAHFLPQVPSSALYGLVRFTYETIFLKYAMRAYKTPGERWEVAALCLNLFDCHLTRYLSSISELTGAPTALEGVVSSPASTDDTHHPGFLIGCQLLTDSPLLKLLLGVVHEGLEELDDYVPDRHPCPKMVSVLTAALRLLDRVLSRQEDLLRVIRAQHSLVNSVRLSKLLMGVNARSGRPDHLVNVVRLASFLEEAPELTRLGLSVLRRCVSLVQPHRDLLTVLTAEWATRTEILRSLVDCLEAEVNGEEEEEEELASAPADTPRLLALEILLASLENPWPNLAHFLLGFRIDRQIRRTVLQEAGVMGFPKTCLHALFSVIEAATDRLVCGQRLATQRLWELALSTRALYRLAVHTDTCEPTLRFCRHSRDLFLSQMNCLRTFPAENDPARMGLLMYQKSWMLRLMAIELHINSLTNQRLGLQALSRRLLGNDDGGGGERGNWLERIAVENVEDDKVLLSMLDEMALPLPMEEPQPQPLHHLNLERFSALVNACHFTNSVGTRLVDLQRLTALMRAEMAAGIAELTPNQVEAVQIEVVEMCDVVEATNRLRLWLHGKQACLEGWRQVAEVLLTASPPDLSPWPVRRAVIVSLLLRLLSDLSYDSTPVQLRPLMSGTVLNLLAELAERWGRRDEEEELGRGNRSVMTGMEFVSLLDTGEGAAEGGQEAAQLRAVLSKLVESVAACSGSSQRVRANLYGALSHLLFIARTQRLAAVPRLGERLFDSMCRDGADGHHVTRMCALSVLDRLLHLDRFSGQWLGHLVRQGYLQHLVDGLREDGKALESLNMPRPPSLAPLFIYRSKMALLCRVASGEAGARALTAAGVMSRLSDCQIYSLRPPDDADDEEEAWDFLPSPAARYWQVLEPALRLAFSLVTTLGVENQAAGQAVLFFLDAHADALLGALHLPGEPFSLLRLRELALLSALLHVTSCSEPEFRDSLRARVKRLAFSLLPSFARSLRDKNRGSGSALMVEEKRSLRYSVVASLLSYVGTTLRVQRHFSPATITFSAELQPLSDQQPTAILSAKADSLTRSRPPLRLLTNILRDAQSCLTTAIDSAATRNTKLRQLSELTSEEIRLLANDLGVSGGSDEEVGRRLEKVVSFLERQVLHLTAVVEHCCYLLWAHVDYFLSRRELQPAAVCEVLAECLPTDSTLKRFARGEPDRIEYIESFVRKLRRLASSVQFM